MTDTPLIYRWECPKGCYVHIIHDTPGLCGPHRLHYEKKYEVKPKQESH